MKILLPITVFLVSVSSFGQIQALKDYDFNKGGYYILGVFSESSPNTLRDSLGEFYTDDVQILNQFKENWVFKEPGHKWACGYHYQILVCRQGQVLESFVINLECNEIVTDQGYFYFELNKLRMFYGKLKKPRLELQTFDSFIQARDYRAKIINDSALILADNPGWIKYEGTFQFDYECPKRSKDCKYDHQQKTLKNIELEIKTAYPGEDFEADVRSSSPNSISIELKCNRSLSDEFKLYKRDTSSYFGKWKPYPLQLATFWTLEPK